MTCTIIMYHYVRPLAGSRIKGLDVSQFEGQLDYLTYYYTLITTERLLDSLTYNKPLPPRSALLTFDDGLMDHYMYVFPRLRSRGLSGAFFLPVSTARDRILLDVHKVHYILASDAPIETLVAAIDDAVEDTRAAYGLKTRDEYHAQYAIANRFDPAEVVYIKRMLQHALPEDLRANITGNLFRKYVSADEKAFADELYVSVPQWREMVAANMHVGSHGDKHLWLSRLNAAEQEREICRSAAFLRALGMDRLTICYPYGDYNELTLSMAGSHGFEAGFTTAVGLAEVTAQNRLTLARLDTNDLPKSGTAGPVTWTQKAR